MRLTSTGLGIGTNSPGYKLDVNGGVRVSGATATAASLPAGVLSYESPVMRCYVGDGTGYSWAFSKRTSSTTTDLMILNDSGNLGLGVAPSAWNSGFKVMDISSYGTVFSYTAGQYTGVINNAYFGSGGWTYKNSFYATMYHQGLNGQHQWFTAPSGTAGTTISSFTQAMTLGSDGNLLVGTTSSSYGGRIVSLAPSTAPALVLDAASGTNTSINFYNAGTIKWTTQVLTTGEYRWYDFTAGAERARIDSSGNLLVGTTNASMQAGGVKLRNASGNLGEISLANNSGATDYVARFLWGSSATLVGNITVSSSATAYNTSSDYRLKNTIAPMTGALAKVALLKPCTYKWNIDGSDGEGFIAHELAEVVPQCVTGEKDAVDEDGNPKYQGIDTSFLVATLTAALQELNAKFDAYVATHP
jgi:hypothetical protein